MAGLLLISLLHRSLNESPSEKEGTSAVMV